MGYKQFSSCEHQQAQSHKVFSAFQCALRMCVQLPGAALALCWFRSQLGTPAFSPLEPCSLLPSLLWPEVPHLQIPVSTAESSVRVPPPRCSPSEDQAGHFPV